MILSRSFINDQAFLSPEGACCVICLFRRSLPTFFEPQDPLFNFLYSNQALLSLFVQTLAKPNVTLKVFQGRGPLLEADAQVLPNGLDPHGDLFLRVNR